jgi:hypothetical protein
VGTAQVRRIEGIMFGMRRIAVLVAVFAVAAPALATPRVPRIWLASKSPAAVAGRGFQAQERVKVVVAESGTRWAKVVDATEAGTFTARFRISVSVRCGSLVAVTATGSKGSRATWKLTEAECPPPIDPGQ